MLINENRELLPGINDLIIRKSVNKKNTIKNIIMIIIALLFFIIILLLYYIKYNIFLLFQEKNNNKNNEKHNFTNQIIINNNKKYNDSNVNKTVERLQILSKGRNYIDNCIKEVSFNNFANYAKVKNPLISVIIPVYNCERTIKWAIKSIQKQNITEIEIILVNDFSKDASLLIITELQKKDLRISIINNKKNYGTLYSRCVGTLLSKGKFIFALDNDDMFFTEDVFDYISKKAMKDNYDIVGFKSVYVHSYNSSVDKMKDGFFTKHQNNLILHQPRLGIYPIYEYGRLWPNDYTIWGKCIKTEFYKKAVNSLGIKRYSTFVSWGEDASIVFVIFNIAQSFIFVHKYGIMHIQNRYCASRAQPKVNKLFGEVFFIDILFDFSKNNTDKRFAVDYALYIKRIHNLKRKIYKNVLLYLKNVLNKIMNSTYITNDKKDILKLNFKDLIS